MVLITLLIIEFFQILNSFQSGVCKGICFFNKLVRSGSLGLYFSKSLTLLITYIYLCHFVKSVRIRSFSGQYFPALGLNTEGYSLSNAGKYGPEKLRIQTLFTHYKFL